MSQTESIAQAPSTSHQDQHDISADGQTNDPINSQDDEPPPAQSHHGTPMPPSPSSQPVNHQQKRSLLQITTIMLSLCLTTLAPAMEATIITPALPAISSSFSSPSSSASSSSSSSSYTWIGTAYILAHTATSPPWASLSNIYGRKIPLLSSSVIFFIGSLLCATIKGSLAGFLLGRVVQGVGAGGMTIVTNITVADLFSERDRGLWYGVLSLVWAVASAIGPVLGGVFTERLTWRWCFWINLPITGLAFTLLLLTLHLPTPKTPLLTGLLALDASGTILIISGTLTLLLGLYFGGVYHPWHSPTVVCLLVFGALTFPLFVANELKIARHPIIPPRLFTSKSSAAAYLVCFFHAFAFMGVAYYFALYCQGVLVVSPLLAGIYMLPFILSISVTAALVGWVIQITGKYIPFIYAGLTLMTIGLGLLTSLPLHVHWPRLIIYQLLAGIGVGMNFEGPLLAVQAAVAASDVATATAAMGFVRSLATAISVVIGGVVFQNGMARQEGYLRSELGTEIAIRLSGSEATSSVEFVQMLGDKEKDIARAAFQSSIRDMWIMYTAFAGAGLLIGLFIRGHDLRKDHRETQLGVASPRDECVVVPVAPDTNNNNQQGEAIRMRRVALHPETAVAS